jgi:ribosomal protein S18 acetylase RimI-like enzyme
MWVAPAVRGRGVGWALVGAVQRWATDMSFGRVGLWVTETNEPALTLYRRCGFTDTGERQPLPSDPALTEVRMLCAL